MNNFALGMTKAVTDFLEQNEKRFVEQQTVQEKQDKLLESLQSKIDSLDIKYQQLIGENAQLRSELESAKKREDEIAKEFSQSKDDIQKVQTRLEEFNKWVQLISIMASEITKLKESSDSTEEKLREIMDNQTEIAQAVKRQQAQLAKTTSSINLFNSTNNAHNHQRIPVKSPSTSSFFNGNNHNSLTRIRNSKPRESSFVSSDANEDISILSDCVEDLLGRCREAEEMFNHQTSFEKNNIRYPGDMN